MTDDSSDAVAFLIIIGVVMNLSNSTPLFAIKEILFEGMGENIGEGLKAS